MELHIDPHVHSALSDGTDAPRDLLLRAREVGLDVVGAVDHDTFDHWASFHEAHAELLAAGANPPAVLLGSEISTSVGLQPVHLLVYLPDPSRGHLHAVLQNVHDERLVRLQRMVENISTDYPITWAEVIAEVPGLTPGRPHLGDALVKKGYFATRSEAFNRVLGPHSPYYVSRPVVDTFEVVAAGLADGGVPVIAHPFAAKRGKRPLQADTVRDLARAGVAGIEVYHRELGAAPRDLALGLAEELGLFVSGGSDYHGRGKPNVLGENLMPSSSLEPILQRGATPLLGELPTRN
ncbi:PHP domain-containing protein [Mobiluncus mulieris]|uniref:PHP domain-containing protein n=1 Tax=Mobiluncus mulieris TaxID=2052 RepID=UPI0021E2B31C|nr:PHP domain-containing protein [Mobiluncus mulieris]MCU9975697.1 PHP domain-containing protein [Mobiluncus mulieris]